MPPAAPPSPPALDLLSSYSTAYHLTRIGYHVLPIVAGSKACAIKDWTNLRIPLREITAYFRPEADLGVGLLLGTEVAPGVFPVAIDIDLDDEVLISRVAAAVGSSSIPAKRGSKGVTFFARSDAPLKARRLRRKDPVTNVWSSAVEILARGEQTVIPPSIHPRGMTYEWVGAPLTDFPPAELPVFDRYVMDEIELAVRRPDAPLFFLNGMSWQGEGGGGDVHNSVVTAVAAMVAMGWPDDQIWARVDRATADAVARAGADYDWPGWRERVEDMARTARAKGFDQGKRENPHLTAARWFVDDWRGAGRVRQRDGMVMVYRDGWFEYFDERAIRHVVAREYPEPTNISMVHNNWVTVARTAADIALPFEARPSRRVCLGNGTFDMDEGRLRPHSPDDYLISGLDFDYDPEAACPLYEGVLYRTLDQGDPENTERAVACFEEFCAMTLFEELRFHKFLVLHGPPQTGKSTLLQVLQSLHSPRAVSAVGVHDFGNERYRAGMVSKLLNITSEVAATSHASDDFLKQVVSGDPVEVRFLYRETFQTVLPVRLVVACNEMFRVRDTSGAVERRMIVLPCDNHVDPSEVDSRLWMKLRAERAGIFRRMAAAWPRLRDRDRFDPPTASTDALRQFSMENNHPEQWFYECTCQGMALVDPEYRPPAELPPTENTMLFLHFTEWSRAQGHRQMSSITWGAKLNQVARRRGIDLDTFLKRMPGHRGGPPIRVRPITLLATPNF